LAEVYIEVETIKNVLNDHLVDAWEQAMNGSRDTQVFSNDFRLTGTFPKVQVAHDEDSPEKIQWGGRSNYVEGNDVKLNIYYYNKPQFKYYVYSYDGVGSVNGSTVYEDGGSNNSRSLNRYMLEQIRETLVRESGSATGSLLNEHKIRFGSIVSTQYDRENQIYWGYVPISFELIKRLGS